MTDSSLKFEELILNSHDLHFLFQSNVIVCHIFQLFGNMCTHMYTHIVSRKNRVACVLISFL